MDHQDSSGCRECSNGDNVCALARPSARRPAGPRAARRPGAVARAAAAADGPCLPRRPDPPIGSGFWVDSRRAAQAQPPGAVGIRPRALPPQERSRLRGSSADSRVFAHRILGSTVSINSTSCPGVLSRSSSLRQAHRRGTTLVLTRPSRTRGTGMESCRQQRSGIDCRFRMIRAGIGIGLRHRDPLQEAFGGTDRDHRRFSE